MSCIEPGCPVLTFDQKTLELLHNPPKVGCFTDCRHHLGEPPELGEVVYLELLN